MTMTATQLKARKKWVLSDRTQKRPPLSKNTAFWLHLRGYHKGDIRCCRCDKWINPDNPFEAIEIKISPRGKRIHDPRYCTTMRGYGISAFSTVSRTGSSKKRGKDGREVFRY